MAAKSKTAGKQRKGRRANQRGIVGRLWSGNIWVLTLLGGIVIILATAAFMTRDSDAFAEEIVAEFTEYDLGEVPIDGGLISREFPIEAAGDATITSIQST